jgi:diguanylate cyclase (GGDEF)-like protein
MEVALVILGALTVGAVVWAVRANGQASRASGVLADLGHLDPLTGLANRQELRTELDRLLHQAHRNASAVAVLAIELERVGQLNDRHGHEVGDRALAAAGHTLREAARRGEVVARYGGPQFVLAIPDATVDTARARAEDLVEVLLRPVAVGDHHIRLTANIGVALADHSTTRAEDALADAQVALHQAASAGEGAVVLFDPSLRSRLIPSAAEHRLRAAIEREEFRLLYLPLVRLDDLRVVGAEALLRWHDPDNGSLGPDRFLRALDETGLIVPVGTWVLREACRQARRWQEALPAATFDLSVNVTPRQLLQLDFADIVRSVLNETGLDPARLCIEITEGSLLGDENDTWAILGELADLGVHLSLDDFGTGTSSLSYVRRIALDTMKIDAMFVEGIARGREDHAIVEELIGLAHALGIQAVAEGVETAEQAELLRGLRCDLAQGYHFAGPLTAEAMEALLASPRLTAAPRAGAARATDPATSPPGTVVPRDVTT